MIATVLRISDRTKSSIRRLADYLMDPKETKERVVCMSATNTKVLEEGRGQGLGREEMDDVVTEMLLTQSLNSRAKGDRTYHLLLSFQEQLDSSKIAEIEDEVCRKLGLGELQRISVVHGDTDHLHVHIAVNLIHPVTHNIKTPWYDELKLMKICEEIEQKHLLAHDNHELRSAGHATRASKMEFCGDMESLAGWIQRNCRKELLEAKSWDEIHELLTMHRIRLVPSTRGLAFTNGDIHVRASTVDRKLSKRNLEKRLGPFREPAQGMGGRSFGMSYDTRPMQYGYDTSELWERYSEERKFMSERRKEAEKHLDEELRRELSRTFTSLSLYGITARYFVRGSFLKRIAWYLESVAKRQKAEKLKKHYKKKLDDLRRRYARSSWREWLDERALEGDEEALRAIEARGGVYRGKKQKIGMAGAVKVSRKGTLLYPDGCRWHRQSISDELLGTCKEQISVASLPEKQLWRV